MNALLISPKIGQTFWNLEHTLRILGKKANQPPLGLLTVAGILPNEWNLKLVDMNTGPLKSETIQWADIVFVGGMIVQKDSTRFVLDICKKMEKPVVLGGPITMSLEETFSDADHIILREAEGVLQQYLRDMQVGKPKHRYGVAPSGMTKLDLGDSPTPRWDLINIRDYAFLSAQFSRGCPHDCEFCDVVKLNGRIPRVKSNQQMMSEFTTMYDTGYRGRVFLVDDNLIGHKTRVKSFLRELAKWQENHHFPFVFEAQSTVSLADDEELLDLMVEAGIEAVFLGLETPDEGALRECGKHHNCDRDLMESVNRIQRNGIEVMGGFIVGFDSDEPRIFDLQKHFIQNSGIGRAMVGMLQALPGTKLHLRLAHEGRLINSGTGNNCDGSVNFVPAMGLQELRTGYNTLMRQLYSPEQVFVRASKLMEKCKVRWSRPTYWSEASTFLRACVGIGILETREIRLYWWKLLWKAMIVNPKLFRQAIMIFLFGYHVMKLVDDLDNYDN